MDNFNPFKYITERFNKLQIEGSFNKSNITGALNDMIEALGEDKFNDQYNGTVSFVFSSIYDYKSDTLEQFHGVVSELFHKAFRQQDVFGDVIRDGGNYDDDEIGHLLKAVMWKLFHASDDFWTVLSEMTYISFKQHCEPELNIKVIIWDAEDYISDKNWKKDAANIGGTD